MEEKLVTWINLCKEQAQPVDVIKIESYAIVLQTIPITDKNRSDVMSKKW